MKDYIEHYYDINIKNISRANDKYYFSSSQAKYIFEEFKGDIKQVEKKNVLIHNYLPKESPYHILIPNKSKSLITSIGEKNYILLKVKEFDKTKITLSELKYNTFINEKEWQEFNRFNWVDLWQKKIDHYEEHIYSKTASFYANLTCFNYFIGLAENAITYVGKALKTEPKTPLDKLVLSHEKMSIELTLEEYYNPVYIMVDHKVRNISEFIKSSFVSGNYDLDLIEKQLEEIDLSKLGVSLFIGRLLFPNFYFDNLGYAIHHQKMEEFRKLEKRANEYQLFITDIYLLMKNKYGIDEIKWLEKR